MILLDTNVISEPLRPAGDPIVLVWLDKQDIKALHISTITLAELRFGIAVLPEGQRRTSLHSNLEQRILPLFAGRILPFDTAAAGAYADLRAEARRQGKAIARTDGYIAAIARARGLSVATRDTAPFNAAGLTVIDPWQS